MPKVIVTTREGEVREVDATAGLSLMEALRRGGITEIQAVCGGCGACCTCQVYIEGGPVAALPAMAELEDALLESSDLRTERSRLACQIPVTDALEGLTVTVAPES
jgi:2Fe-2S ferredoxin